MSNQKPSVATRVAVSTSGMMARWALKCVYAGIFCCVGAMAMLLVERAQTRAAYTKMYQELALKGPNYRDVLAYYRHCQSGQPVREPQRDCVGATEEWAKQLPLGVPFATIAQDIREGEASVSIRPH
ncbi:hypothetical protein RBE51_21230 [Pseudomonas taiwanensis]|uniref:hypothetical protein n=1 Tax=Pseudomonas taiwanensis TaxID=470150 RepID=UPI0028DEB0F4|nr:hypothetical protein [Pseudomonas taiwanensis]MDT8925321.1 hypothetical protein [Pseudomonas taiwanensis]